MSEFDVYNTANDYISWDSNDETRKLIESLINNKNEKELTRLLSTRLAFGTAGLRGPMGAGYNSMNTLVILQTTQGLVRYLEAVLGDNAKKQGVVIGYDHRALGSLSSLQFARVSAAVLLGAGFKVYCLEDYVPTPFVAFGVTLLGAAAGIMVTASHNPKMDNGFKVYWGNGSQIIPPHDIEIAKAIDSNLKPWGTEISLDSVLSHHLAENATTKVADSYYQSIIKLSTRLSLNKNNPIAVVYTPMHGVGLPWIERAFQTFNNNKVLSVPSQSQPDPDFKTVSFPNPEEKGALDEAMKFADLHNANIIIANDPDADRLAVAEKVGSKWKIFSGNEIGVILGHWQISQAKAANKDTSKSALLASVVSSRMLKSIAEQEHILYYDTLTGFKWLGNKAIELKQQGIEILLAYEEALGYCLGDVVNDKDGISAASVFVEFLGSLAEKNMSVQDYLRSLYSQYGEFVSYNSYVICHDPIKTNSIFERIRTGGPNNGYFQESCNHKISRIKDVTVGYDSNSIDLKSDLPITPDSHMIMFEFENDLNPISMILRTSGTEPKIKFYTEIKGQPGQAREQLEEKLHTFVDLAVEHLLEPTIHGLKKV